MKKNIEIPNWWNHKTTSFSVALQMLIFWLAISPLFLVLGIIPTQYDWMYICFSIVMWLSLICLILIDYKEAIKNEIKRAEELKR